MHPGGRVLFEKASVWKIYAIFVVSEALFFWFPVSVVYFFWAWLSDSFLHHVCLQRKGQIQRQFPERIYRFSLLRHPLSYENVHPIFRVSKMLTPKCQKEFMDNEKREFGVWKTVSAGFHFWCILFRFSSVVSDRHYQ
jgi:hypothetical protein